MKTPTLSKEAEKVEYIKYVIKTNINSLKDESFTKLKETTLNDIDLLVSAAIQAERKAIYKMVMENGSANRASILHKLTRIIQGEEKL